MTTVTQAAAMRSMDYGTIRRMNPEMAGFSDAMIDNAITQVCVPPRFERCGRLRFAGPW
jgi:hypothetical protein